MPAKNLFREDGEGTYSHVYNKGIEKRVIFKDEEDYEVFLGYLKEYLTAPQDPENIKKAFTVQGRVYKGVPHQPKNYFNKIELVSYSLKPNRFHLLLHQLTQGSIERLIRSLCTRYSIYFNKKYQHTGSLFEGPYKSVPVRDETLLLHLTRYLHHIGGYSSYAEYLGTRESSWVKPQTILSIFGQGTEAYKNFVEAYGFDQKDRQLIAGITFEDEIPPLERRILKRLVVTGNYENNHQESPTSPPNDTPNDSYLKFHQRIPELLASIIVFLLLIAFGTRNTMIVTAKSVYLPPSYSVLSEEIAITETPAPTTPPDNIEFVQIDAAPTVPPTETFIEEVASASAEIVPAKIMLKVNITVESTNVNIRQKPTVDSVVITKANNGDEYEFVAINSDWYEVRLPDGLTGFISAQFIEIGGIDN